MFSFCDNYESWLRARLLAYRALLHRCSAKTRMMMSREQTHQCDVCCVILSWSYLHDSQENSLTVSLLLWSTYPNFKSKVRAVKEDDVTRKSIFVVFPRVFPPCRGFLICPAFDFSATEKSEHFGSHRGNQPSHWVSAHPHFISSWFLVWSGPVFLPLQPKHISEISFCNV